MKKNLEQEKDTVDLVTDSMFAIDFLHSVTHAIFEKGANQISLLDFYKQWLKRSGVKDFKIPFNLGAFAGYLYCGLLITKENWSDLLPDEPISRLEPEWGLGNTKCLPERNPDPKLRYFIRRLRNSIGHTGFYTDVPKREQLSSLDQILDLTRWTFSDVNPKDTSDWFEVTLTMRQLITLIKKFQSIVHQSLRS